MACRGSRMLFVLSSSTCTSQGGRRSCSSLVGIGRPTGLLRGGADGRGRTEPSVKVGRGVHGHGQRLFELSLDELVKVRIHPAHFEVLENASLLAVPFNFSLCLYSAALKLEFVVITYLKNLGCVVYFCQGSNYFSDLNSVLIRKCSPICIEIKLYGNCEKSYDCFLVNDCKNSLLPKMRSLSHVEWYSNFF